MPGPLVERFAANPFAPVSVIVQGTRGTSARNVSDAVARSSSRTLKMTPFSSIPAVAVELRAMDAVRLAAQPHIFAITENSPMAPAAYTNAAYTNPARWPLPTGINRLWTGGPGSKAVLPAIAIVDTGVDAGREDFGGRVVREVTLTPLPGNSPGDGRGHGTFVAGLAAGGAAQHAGAAPGAPIVSIDVADDEGMALTSDVIAAVDWILANKRTHDIRVANLSLHSSQPSSFVYDPLDRAVERLWHSGVVVVAAAGNYASDGNASGVPFAPANDPFVLTVGAADIGESASTSDDVAAPWSAHGYTPDGFAKPELGAPGRYLVGPVSAGATLATERPGSVVEAGYMRLSGTSFAAPIVAGAAAQILARHPDLTPDQVKGALMASASGTASLNGALGIGELNAAAAADLLDPPNPNAALNHFLVSEHRNAIPVFDAASWTSAARADTSWDAASWTSASWTSASWTSASWTSASWTSASWTSASWTSASWTSASWTSASWTSAAIEEIEPGP